MEPLVSCVLVTRDRPAFVRQALRCYGHQTYPNREIVVVDDGAEPVGTLCRGVANLTYIRLRESTPTGTKLNIGVDAARGNILQKIDDDDFYAPAFLSTAVQHLRRTRKTRVLVAWCCFAILIAGHRRLYFSGHGWNSGGTFCFRRRLWARRQFRDIYASSDSWFIRDNQPTIVRVCAAEQYVVVRHGRNTWQRIKSATGVDSVEAYFRRKPFTKNIREVVGEAHVAFYRAVMTGRAMTGRGFEPWTPSV